MSTCHATCLTCSSSNDANTCLTCDNAKHFIKDANLSKCNCDLGYVLNTGTNICERKLIIYESKL